MYSTSRAGFSSANCAPRRATCTAKIAAALGISHQIDSPTIDTSGSDTRSHAAGTRCSSRPVQHNCSTSTRPWP